MILFTADTSISQTLEAIQTPAIAAEVQTDLQQLKPHVILDTIRGWTPALLTLAYRLAIAALIIVIGMRAAHSLRKFLKKTFSRMNLDLGLSKFLISLANALAYAITIFIALEKIGIPSASILALLGSATLAIGLSLQGSLANFAGGILILVMRPFSIDDYIICQGVEGTVHNIGLVYTTLVTVDNKKITVPNGNLANDIITNVTAQEKRRVDISVGIGYSSDIKAAKDILNRLYHENPLVLKDETISVFVDQLADSAVILGARGWTATEDYWTVKWQITEQIKEEFDRAGIEIPFNQLDVNLKTPN
jgi:small conductance mechanosensitive channel